MKRSIIYNSLYCGLITYATVFIFGLSNFIPLLLLCGIILPGFMYAITITSSSGKEFHIETFFFILFSGLLFIFNAWVVTGYSVFSKNPVLSILAAGIFGSVSLIILYYFLIDRNISLKKGILYSLGIGTLTAVFPLIGFILEKETVDIKNSGEIFMGFTLLVFPAWQVSFGWTLYTLHKQYKLRTTGTYNV